MNIDISCDHIQFIVADAAKTAEQLTSRFGFGPVSVDADMRTVVLSQGTIVVLVSEPPDDGPGREFLAAHGDGLARIGFSCTDVRAAYERAVTHGARSIDAPRQVAETWTAAVAGIGDLTHTLIEQSPTTQAPLLPGVGRVPRLPATSSAGLTSIDHFAICLPRGRLADTAEHYRLAWGFEEIFREKIVVGAQAMDSLVVASRDRGVILTLIEPAGSAPGQIDLFLEQHGGPGVQHIAFGTADIVSSVRQLHARGVTFADTDDSYYADLETRLDRLRHGTDELHALGILADRDHDGDLYQIFARSTHERGTYFFEIVERDGAQTFGSNNVRFLFQSKARELAAPLPSP